VNEIRLDWARAPGTAKPAGHSLAERPSRLAATTAGGIGARLSRLWSTRASGQWPSEFPRSLGATDAELAHPADLRPPTLDELRWNRILADHGGTSRRW
jgi:hypothetical protein